MTVEQARHCACGCGTLITAASTSGYAPGHAMRDPERNAKRLATRARNKQGKTEVEAETLTEALIIDGELTPEDDALADATEAAMPHRDPEAERFRRKAEWEQAITEADIEQKRLDAERIRPIRRQVAEPVGFSADDVVTMTRFIGIPDHFIERLIEAMAFVEERRRA